MLSSTVRDSLVVPALAGKSAECSWRGLLNFRLKAGLRTKWDSRIRSLMILTVLCGSLSAFAGCNRKEKVIDIETPAGDIEVERSKDTGKIDINVDVDRK